MSVCEHSRLGIGARVTYLAGRRRDWSRVCRRATIVAEPIFDRYTTTWWVPVKAVDSAVDREPSWVKSEQIVDVEAAI
ncbi:hypothetical protein [Prauserella cavernicola]|uniref:Uncharacterized protein n=1 Tax=Prauserella cavernicola TaxID=2800127 RepID=A0A934QP86_9PSEU|nr:hypothetical protein [Prauserella cavernicola]MBK1783513.1 hypothetical protein [Prauserella cavernicola]